jgi:hypothetical protein
MIDLPVLAALTRAWFTTVIASTLLVTALLTEPVWNSPDYWRSLPEAFALDGAGGPLPAADPPDRPAASARGQAARAGHTGW